MSAFLDPYVAIDVDPKSVHRMKTQNKFRGKKDIFAKVTKYSVQY